jgi:hypothetical protein
MAEFFENYTYKKKIKEGVPYWEDLDLRYRNSEIIEVHNKKVYRVAEKNEERWFFGEYQRI